ncbi:MAG: tetratricopeptide repeat protein [Syntrophales bacterium]|nr:tetratricopeptide repeat protein [Syntrophales bacterium]
MVFLEKKAKGVPPGLLRLVKEGKHFPKVVFIILSSVLALIAGFGVLYLFENKNFQKMLTVSQRSEGVGPALSSQMPVVSYETKDTDKVTQRSARFTAAFDPLTHGTNRLEKRSVQQTEDMKQPKFEKKGVIKENEGKVISVKAAIREVRKEKSSEAHSKKTLASINVGHLYRAYDLETEGKLEEAVREYIEYTKTIELKDPLIIHKIVTLYLLLGNLQEASRWADFALREWPNNPLILANCGLLKAKLGNFNEAEGLFKRAIELDPENKNALFNFAVLKEKKKEYHEALTLYERLSERGDLEAQKHVMRLKTQESDLKSSQNK